MFKVVLDVNEMPDLKIGPVTGYKVIP